MPKEEEQSTLRITLHWETIKGGGNQGVIETRVSMLQNRSECTTTDSITTANARRDQQLSELHTVHVFRFSLSAISDPELFLIEKVLPLTY